jgi:DNA-binding MarR family transcriptional regulator
MWNSSSPQALAERLSVIAEGIDDAKQIDRAGRVTRILLSAIAAHEPATLGTVAKATARGAPAVSRSVDALVRSGLVEREADPANRRRLALRLSESGREQMVAPTRSNAALAGRLQRLAHSELRAIDRALEILERMPR